MRQVEKKFIIKSVSSECVLSETEYGQGLIGISSIYHSPVVFFDTKEEAEENIIANRRTAVTIVEIFK